MSSNLDKKEIITILGSQAGASLILRGHGALWVGKPENKGWVYSGCAVASVTLQGRPYDVMAVTAGFHGTMLSLLEAPVIRPASKNEDIIASALMCGLGKCERCLDQSVVRTLWCA